MRIAYLCKRQYMRKDVIADRYARLYEQPRQLALRGHEVLGLSLSYRRTDPRDEWHEAEPGSMHWVGLAPSPPGCGLLAYPWRALARLRAFSPDLLVAASDSPHVVLGGALARLMGIPLAVDLYDDFESFGLTRLPGLRRLYRRVLRRAAVVSCVSEWLARRVLEEYRAQGRVLSLPSTIDRSVFRPLDRGECRRQLGLPPYAKLVGTAGGLEAAKGIAPVYEAFERLAADGADGADGADWHLVLAGGLDPACPPPSGPNVHYLGMLPHGETARLFNALDVGIVYLRDTPYGQASFPQKAYEMAACGLPLAVARVGAMAELFAATPATLYEADDAGSLAHCLRLQMEQRNLARLDIRDWADLALEMEQAYADTLAQWRRIRA